MSKWTAFYIKSFYEKDSNEDRYKVFVLLNNENSDILAFPQRESKLPLKDGKKITEYSFLIDKHAEFVIANVETRVIDNGYFIIELRHTDFMYKVKSDKTIPDIFTRWALDVKQKIANAPPVVVKKIIPTRIEQPKEIIPVVVLDNSNVSIPQDTQAIQREKNVASSANGYLAIDSINIQASRAELYMILCELAHLARTGSAFDVSKDTKSRLVKIHSKCRLPDADENTKNIAEVVEMYRLLLLSRGFFSDFFSIDAVQPRYATADFGDATYAAEDGIEKASVPLGCVSVASPMLVKNTIIGAYPGIPLSVVTHASLFKNFEYTTDSPMRDKQFKDIIFTCTNPFTGAYLDHSRDLKTSPFTAEDSDEGYDFAILKECKSANISNNNPELHNAMFVVGTDGLLYVVSTQEIYAKHSIVIYMSDSIPDAYKKISSGVKYMEPAVFHERRLKQEQNVKKKVDKAFQSIVDAEKTRLLCMEPAVVTRNDRTFTLPAKDAFMITRNEDGGSSHVTLDMYYQSTIKRTMEVVENQFNQMTMEGTIISRSDASNNIFQYSNRPDMSMFITDSINKTRLLAALSYMRSENLKSGELLSSCYDAMRNDTDATIDTKDIFKTYDLSEFVTDPFTDTGNVKRRDKKKKKRQPASNKDEDVMSDGEGSESTENDDDSGQDDNAKNTEGDKKKKKTKKKEEDDAMSDGGDSDHMEEDDDSVEEDEADLYEKEVEEDDKEREKEKEKEKEKDKGKKKKQEVTVDKASLDLSNIYKVITPSINAFEVQNTQFGEMFEARRNYDNGFVVSSITSKKIIKANTIIDFVPCFPWKTSEYAYNTTRKIVIGDCTFVATRGSGVIPDCPYSMYHDIPVVSEEEANVEFAVFVGHYGFSGDVVMFSKKTIPNGVDLKRSNKPQQAYICHITETGIVLRDIKQNTTTPMINPYNRDADVMTMVPLCMVSQMNARVYENVIAQRKRKNVPSQRIYNYFAKVSEEVKKIVGRHILDSGNNRTSRFQKQGEYSVCKNCILFDEIKHEMDKLTNIGLEELSEMKSQTPNPIRLAYAEVVMESLSRVFRTKYDSNEGRAKEYVKTIIAGNDKITVSNQTIEEFIDPSMVGEGRICFVYQVMIQHGFCSIVDNEFVCDTDEGNQIQNYALSFLGQNEDSVQAAEYILSFMEAETAKAEMISESQNPESEAFKTAYVKFSDTHKKFYLAARVFCATPFFEDICSLQNIKYNATYIIAEHVAYNEMFGLYENLMSKKKSQKKVRKIQSIEDEEEEEDAEFRNSRSYEIPDYNIPFDIWLTIDANAANYNNKITAAMGSTKNKGDLFDIVRFLDFSAIVDDQTTRLEENEEKNEFIIDSVMALIGNIKNRKNSKFYAAALRLQIKDFTKIAFAKGIVSKGAKISDNVNIKQQTRSISKFMDIEEEMLKTMTESSIAAHIQSIFGDTRRKQNISAMYLSEITTENIVNRKIPPLTSIDIVDIFNAEAVAYPTGSPERVVLKENLMMFYAERSGFRNKYIADFLGMDRLIDSVLASIGAFIVSNISNTTFLINWIETDDIKTWKDALDHVRLTMAEVTELAESIEKLFEDATVFKQDGKSVWKKAIDEFLAYSKSLLETKVELTTERSAESLTELAETYQDVYYKRHKEKTTKLQDIKKGQNPGFSSNQKTYENFTAKG